MEKWVKDNIKPEYGEVTAVGTGGNISKIFELAKIKVGKKMALKKIRDIKAMVEGTPWMSVFTTCR